MKKPSFALLLTLALAAVVLDSCVWAHPQGNRSPEFQSAGGLSNSYFRKLLKSRWTTLQESVDDSRRPNLGELPKESLTFRETKVRRASRFRSDRNYVVHKRRDTKCLPMTCVNRKRDGRIQTVFSLKCEEDVVLGVISAKGRVSLTFDVRNNVIYTADGCSTERSVCLSKRKTRSMTLSCENGTQLIFKDGRAPTISYNYDQTHFIQYIVAGAHDDYL